MAGLNNFSTAPAAAAQVTIPTHTIAAQVIGDDGTTIIADYTGAAALSWPAVISTLSAAQRQAIVDQIAELVIFQKAGLQ